MRTSWQQAMIFRSRVCSTYVSPAPEAGILGVTQLWGIEQQGSLAKASEARVWFKLRGGKPSNSPALQIMSVYGLLKSYPAYKTDSLVE